MAKRKKPALQPSSTQPNTPSRFQALPGELRNNIYELAAGNESDTIHLRRGEVLYGPPLSLTCKQTRQEYKNIYIQTALQDATTVAIHITNFQATREDLRPSRQTLTTNFSASTGIAMAPATPPHSLMSNLSIYQRYMLDLTGRDPWHTTIIITLTNTFDSYLHAMQVMQKDALLQNLSYEVRVNPTTFDFDYCRELFGRLRYADEKLVDAVGEMLGRCAQKSRKGKGRERKRDEVEGVE